MREKEREREREGEKERERERGGVEKETETETETDRTLLNKTSTVNGGSGLVMATQINITELVDWGPLEGQPMLGQGIWRTRSQNQDTSN